MKIISSGSKYNIYNDDIKTYDNLPVGVYKVRFHPLAGFSLEQIDDISKPEFKIYGSAYADVDRVLNSYAKSDRNLGVLLSGTKGSGKSLFARILCNRAIEKGMPIIMIDNKVQGLSEFINSIKQECVIWFDEFEKNYKIAMDYDSDDDNSSGEEQDQFLSLLDGTDNGKRLFVFTANEVNRISKFLINRPGRIHYHFKITTPSSDDIKEYMKDNSNASENDIVKICTMATISEITYDVLRALCFEMNQGYSFDDCIRVLNIERNTGGLVHITVDAGEFGIYGASSYLDGDGVIDCWLSNKDGSHPGEDFKGILRIKSMTATEDGSLIVSKDDLKISACSDFIKNNKDKFFDSIRDIRIKARKQNCSSFSFLEV